MAYDRVIVAPHIQELYGGNAFLDKVNEPVKYAGSTNSLRNSRIAGPARPVRRVVSHGFYSNHPWN